ncbi:MAG: hypothetical protein M3R02_00220 [Chloroflexota bacterium]|nr:hypothetical protein [Chloroflexota bacterium]
MGQRFDQLQDEVERMLRDIEEKATRAAVVQHELTQLKSEIADLAVRRAELELDMTVIERLDREEA